LLLLSLGEGSTSIVLSLLGRVKPLLNGRALLSSREVLSAGVVEQDRSREWQGLLEQLSRPVWCCFQIAPLLALKLA
jgi:hypothetical protein